VIDANNPDYTLHLDHTDQIFSDSLEQIWKVRASG
jgi:hypothetical protein